MTELLYGNNWRRSSCLGCGETVKRARDAHVEMIGTRSGSWIAALSVSAGRGYGDDGDPPVGEQLYLLGISHSRCIRQARDSLRAQAAELPGELVPVAMDTPPEWDPHLDLVSPVRPKSCPFCEEYEKDPSDEDIFPKWLLKHLISAGARIKLGELWSTKPVGPLAYACRDCNNTWMSTVENDLQPLFLDLFYNARTISSEEQERLAFWAAIKAILIDSSSANPIIPRGFGQDLRIRKTLPPGIEVWMAAYNDQVGLLNGLHWPIFAKTDADDPSQAIACCITIVAFRTVFQVLIPFSDGTHAEFADFNSSVVPLWPVVSPIDWPPPYCFDNDSIVALGARIYNNREPVITTVTLKAAIRGAPDESETD